MSKGVVDIVFLIDATGSMQPCINAVKDNVFTFVRTMCEKDGNGEGIVKDWRARAAQIFFCKIFHRVKLRAGDGFPC